MLAALWFSNNADIDLSKPLCVMPAAISLAGCDMRTRSTKKHPFLSAIIYETDAAVDRQRDSNCTSLVVQQKLFTPITARLSHP